MKSCPTLCSPLHLVEHDFIVLIPSSSFSFHLRAVYCKTIPGSRFVSPSKALWNRRPNLPYELDLKRSQSDRRKIILAKIAAFDIFPHLFRQIRPIGHVQHHCSS